MTIKDGGPAFPFKTAHDPMFIAQNNAMGIATNEYARYSGMTLRDYFAAKCAAAMASTIRSDDDYFRAKKIAEYHGMASVSDWFAHDSYKQADAMLRAREVTP